MTSAFANNIGLLNRFFGRSSDRGSIAITFAMTLPVFVAVTCATVDYAAMVRQKSVQQTATDTAAFVAAKGMSLSNADKENQAAVIGAMVQSYLANNIPDSERSGDFRFTTTISSDPTEVKIVVVQSPKTFFKNGFGLLDTEISTQAVARVIGQPNICVLALSDDIGGAITLEESAVIRGDNCAVFSNSTHTDSIKSKKSSLLKAQTILSNNARVLLGTVYLPKGQLYIETEQPVADNSAYTAIVADTVHLLKKPQLVLNTNYSDTTVPVPNGIKGAGQPIRLVK